MNAGDLDAPVSQPLHGIPYLGEGAGSACPAEEVEQSVPARFEMVAALCPTASAVRCEGRAISYDTLNRSANRIARAVTAVSGEACGRIALLFRHRPPALAAMLGVLKAGKTYLPLDPSYPEARTAFILEDCRPDLILVHRDTASQAEVLARGRCPVLDIDEIDAALPDDNPGRIVSPDALAYIIYTSGSTGRPKGVMQTHRNLLHFIRSYSSGLRISAADRLSLIPSFSFSASLMDIYGALLNGAALSLFDIREEGSAGLARWLMDERITVYHSVPTLFRHFLAGLSGEEHFPYLRAIDLGGEPLFGRDVELFQRHFAKECIMVNHLAFTEASVVARNFICMDSIVPTGRVPAGRPADGVEVSLIDESGQPAEDGRTGEIVLRSRYLSPGYWGQTDLTLAAFAPAPDGSGLRLYRSGDLGRFRPDGALEYLGRKDFRVKIRGFTVEPAEIEAVLIELDSIRDAAVMAREKGAGEQLLVAYLVAEGLSPPSAGALREILRDRLPDYMVPAEFVFLDALPLNPNGKVDRSALPAAHTGMTEPDLSRPGPRNDTERRLADLWRQVLVLDEVTVTDNFFDLGGHSLRAFQLFAGIEKTFGKRLSPSVLLRSPTIELLAVAIDGPARDEASTAAVSLVPIRPAGPRPPLFCIAPVADNALWYRELVEYIDPEHPVYCIDSSEKALAVSMEEMAARCVAIMKTVAPSGPFFLIGYSSGGIAAFEAARQLRGTGLPVALLAMLDSPCPVPDGKRGVAAKLAFLVRVCRNFPGWLYYYWRGTGHKAAQLNIVLRRTLGLPVDESSDPFHLVGRYLEKVSSWLRHYRLEPYQGRIVFYRARGQKLLRHLKLDEVWRKFAERVDTYPVPGHHEQILKEPYVRVLADKINRELRDARV
jgi:amino acid adenylation domain-containing protein